MYSLGTALPIYTPLQTGARSVLLDSLVGADGADVAGGARASAGHGHDGRATHYDQLVASG